MKRVLTWFTVGLVGVSLTVPERKVFAQGLEKIVETARKREESLQEIPIAISAFSATDVQEAGLSSLVELFVNNLFGEDALATGARISDTPLPVTFVPSNIFVFQGFNLTPQNRTEVGTRGSYRFGGT